MSSLSSSPAPKLLPWGRLVLLSKQKSVSLPDHYDLLRSKHRIGRVANRCDIHIPKTFISSLHCIIRLEGKDSQGEPIIEIEDTSRHGVWVNQQKVGTRRKVPLKKGYVIHFTPPGLERFVEELLLEGGEPGFNPFYLCFMYYK